MTRIRISLLILFALVLLALAGPRVEVDQSFDPVTPGEDVDAWLREKEGKIEGIRDGLQKRVIWADSVGVKTRYSVVYLHGFSSSSRETRPFSDSVAARLGANLFYTRFAGHGRDGRALGRSRAHDWIQDTIEGVRVGEVIGERVVLVSTSTGSTLAAWLVAQSELSSSVVAQIWISPNFAPADTRSSMMLWPWGRFLLKIIQGDTFEWTTQNELHAAAGTHSFGSDVLLEMMGLVDLVRHQDFSKITVPTFMVYSPNDSVVDQSVSIEIWDALGSSVKDSMVVFSALDTSNHVLVGDALGPQNTIPVLKRTMEFLHTALEY